MSPWQQLLNGLLSVQSRICSGCGASKPLTRDFWYFQKQYKKRRDVTVYVALGTCRECVKSAAKRNHDENRDRNLTRMRRARVEDPDRFRQYDRTNRARHPEKIKERNKAAYEKDREARKAYQRQLRIDDPERIRQQDRDRRAADPEKYKERARARRVNNTVLIREQDRTRRIPIREFLAAQQREARKAHPERYRGYDLKRKGFSRSVSASVTAKINKQLREVGSRKEKLRRLITGWRIVDLAAHLEPLFEEGMSFDNWGEWQVDHIIPTSLVRFNCEDDPAFKEVWSLSNLAPLWAFDNNAKHNRLDWVMPKTYRNERLRAMYKNPPMKHLVGDFSGFSVDGDDLCS